MRLRTIGGLLLFVRQALTQDVVFQDHLYTVDWEDWPSYFIDEPQVAVCYHRLATEFDACVSICSSMSGKTPDPANPNCDMIITRRLFDDLPRFNWTAFGNHTTVDEEYQFLFILQSDNKTEREVFTTGEFEIKAFDADAVPEESPSELLIEAKAADVTTPPLEPESSPTPDPTAVEEANPSNTNPANGPSNSAEISEPTSTPAGVIVGGVLGGVGGAAIIALVGFLLLRNRRARNTARTSTDTEATVVGDEKPDDRENWAVSEMVGSPAGSELEGPRPVAEMWTGPMAELDGSQTAELVGTRLSQIGVASTRDAPKKMAPDSPTLHQVSPVDDFRENRL